MCGSELLKVQVCHFESVQVQMCGGELVRARSGGLLV